ncbi:hypothetical protein [Polaromonas sp.]|uniref:hypothetical protein n=1 Tax=Polaromonas sp. TaxID=1869339 RepID=UPI00272F9014|nr:hypothetical protein [Polaromonas sp.]MDP1740712.1 hypothetical protein [Polaromonas sp.]
MLLQKIFRVIITLVLVAGLAACATGTPFTETAAPSSGNGVVYVYRPDRSFASWGCPQFSIDGGAVRSMQNGGFHRLELPQGQHLLKSQNSWCSVFPVARAFALREGETIFIRYNVLSDYKPGFHRYDGPDNIYHGYEIVSRDVALPQLKELRASAE